jgi:hypothetical protein
MSQSFTLPDDVASSLVAEAANRDMTPHELAAEFIAARFSSTPRRRVGHRLSFAAAGASASGHRARDDEQMLAEGFGR